MDGVVLRRLMPVLLVVFLCFACCATAFAADGETEIVGDFHPIDIGESAEAQTGPTEPDTSPDEESAASPSRPDQPGAGSETEVAEWQDDGSTQPDERDTAPSPGTDKPQGIPLDDGSTLTVDDRGHLALVDAAGRTRVLDESQTYAIESNSGGAVAIRNGNGDEATVEGTTVSYVDGEGNRVEADAAAESGRDVESSSAVRGVDETELIDADGRVDGDNAESAAAQGVPPAAAIAVIAVVVVAGIVLWRRRKR